MARRRNYKRDKRGRFARVNGLRSSGTKVTRSSRVVGSANPGGTGTAVGKKFIHEQAQKDWTGPRPKKAAPAISRKPAVVPYARASLRSQTVGVNAGANVSRGTRVSGGIYFRVERRQQSTLEKNIHKVDRQIVKGITRRISPSRAADPYIEDALRKGRRKLVNKTIGGQVKIGRNASSRLTTTQGGLPSVSIRKGTARVSAARRRAAIDDFNKAMEKSLKGRRAKKSRPQRRRKAS